MFSERCACSSLPPPPPPRRVLRTPTRISHHQQPLATPASMIIKCVTVVRAYTHSTHIFLRDQKRDTPPLYGAFWGVEQVYGTKNGRAIKKRHSKPPKLVYFF